MKNSIIHIIVFMSACTMLYSCSAKISANIYKKQSTRIDSIHAKYKRLYQEKPFSVEFGDRKFNRISFEILTDTIRYIYHFRLDQPNLADTLDKYGYPAEEIAKLIADMKLARCTWINMLTYYPNRQRNDIINLSVRAKKWDSWLKSEKYYTIAYFNTPQITDKKGRLVEHENALKPMRINNAVYRKINDSIFYAITEHFR